ncbi:MAG: FGGY family carbohydrate kinase [Candidatus Paceibacterota bacterium]
MSDHIFLVLDSGVSEAKAYVFDAHDSVLGRAYQPISKTRPNSGWVEQDPDELISAARAALSVAVDQSNVSPNTIISMGIANQRETVVAWDLATGEALAPAILGDDSRTQGWCEQFYGDVADRIREKTGLLVRATFSASKIRWLLDMNSDVVKAEEEGKLAVGTVDSWLLFKLSEEGMHMCDMTNASRTLLYNIHGLTWDRELLELFGIDPEILPSVRSSRALYGTLRSDICGCPAPIEVMCGDQQASMAAAGFTSHMTKVSYGSKTHVMQTLGDEFLLEDSFLTTLTPDAPIGSVQYALEASICDTGEKVTDALGHEEQLKKVLDDIVRQVDSSLSDLPYPTDTLIVDGGITQNDHLIRLQADVTGAEVVRQPIYDGAALGVMRLLSSIHHGA